eukprot:gnl/TRDRNA2_/TRDRNA2_168205_c0_seq1.p1 gnl/TRDRNA2_/TRDRNA2_168205_c0~~gnl/TRDRNA2_/TRDRNA2_168205_c0_seq1.p1  ORF type:complete len:514 (-),score=45.36 gnl/TRDRNA2_/TRDRNA2_168205_c0_seq1:95-1636(-)
MVASLTNQGNMPITNTFLLCCLCIGLAVRDGDMMQANLEAAAIPVTKGDYVMMSDSEGSSNVGVVQNFFVAAGVKGGTFECRGPQGTRVPCADLSDGLALVHSVERNPATGKSVSQFVEPKFITKNLGKVPPVGKCSDDCRLFAGDCYQTEFCGGCHFCDASASKLRRIEIGCNTQLGVDEISVSGAGDSQVDGVYEIGKQNVWGKVDNPRYKIQWSTQSRAWIIDNVDGKAPYKTVGSSPWSTAWNSYQGGHSPMPDVTVGSDHAAQVIGHLEMIKLKDEFTVLDIAPPHPGGTGVRIVDLTDFESLAHAQKYVSALQVVVRAINSAEFKRQVEATPMEMTKPETTAHNKWVDYKRILSREEIYDYLMSGQNDMLQGANRWLEMSLRMADLDEYTIAQVTGKSRVVQVNRKRSDDIYDIAKTLLHEYMHNLGFTHPEVGCPRKCLITVPYAMGNIVRTVGRQMDADRLRQLPSQPVASQPAAAHYTPPAAQSAQVGHTSNLDKLLGEPLPWE